MRIMLSGKGSDSFLRTLKTDCPLSRRCHGTLTPTVPLLSRQLSGSHGIHALECQELVVCAQLLYPSAVEDGNLVRVADGG